MVFLSVIIQPRGHLLNKLLHPSDKMTYCALFRGENAATYLAISSNDPIGMCFTGQFTVYKTDLNEGRYNCLSIFFLKVTVP